MKFILNFNLPEGIDLAVMDIVEAGLPIAGNVVYEPEVYSFLEQWVNAYGEYISVQFDTERNTASVIDNGIS